MLLKCYNLVLHSHSQVDNLCACGVLHISNIEVALYSVVDLWDFLLSLQLVYSQLGMDAPVDS